MSISEEAHIDYPCFGYVYRADGYHTGKQQLDDWDDVESFLVANAPIMWSGREVMLTDVWDYALFHAKDGVIIHPTREQNEAARKREKERSD